MKMLGHKREVRSSQVREVLESEMMRNPAYWRSYYRGDDDELRLSRAFSFSDRCRYYWPQPSVQEEVNRLLQQSRPLFMPADPAEPISPDRI
jgi:D-tagatose-1,6-bisphosphate aldolase subunit GatZ/KbaZ